ncbi:MAG: lysophospholipid acyltransferase family protein [Ignavibacteriae bacterium]|nr:lysophospholipid acyltransferase family protein [Ignavibacteriota bacterium]
MGLKLSHRLGIFLVRLISKTWRYEIIGNVPKKPSIISFWHGLMLPVWKYFSKNNPTAVVSLSKDGEVLSGILEKWGYRLIRGSSSKGGKEVLEFIIEIAKDGFTLITPDGPQGPIYEFKAGAVIASQRSGVPLILCGVKIKCNYTFKKSWDRFLFPYPFSKIMLNFSEPIIIDKELNKEEINKLLKECEIKLKELSNFNE